MDSYNEEVFTLVASLAETSKLITLYVQQEAKAIEAALKFVGYNEQIN